MNKALCTLALLAAFAAGQAIHFQPPARWTFPSLLDLVELPVHATYRPTVIKSIQRGAITVSATTSATAGIASVDVNNAVVSYLHNQATTTTLNPERAWTRVTLTNATTVTATKNDATDTSTVGFEVAEFYAGVLNSAVQRGTITVAAASTSNTAAITSVTTAKALLMFLGMSADATAAAGGVQEHVFTRLTLTNATTVTATRTNSIGNIVVSYQVAEFK